MTAPDGLKLVTAVTAAGIPLHGTGPANPGVPDCFALVAEFDRCKAGGLPPPSRVRTAEELAAEDAQPHGDQLAAWARLVKAARRLARRRRLWACLGRWLQEVRCRGLE